MAPSGPPPRRGGTTPRGQSSSLSSSLTPPSPAASTSTSLTGTISRGGGPGRSSRGGRRGLYLHRGRGARGGGAPSPHQPPQPQPQQTTFATWTGASEPAENGSSSSTNNNNMMTNSSSSSSSSNSGLIRDEVGGSVGGIGQMSERAFCLYHLISLDLSCSLPILDDRSHRSSNDDLLSLGHDTETMPLPPSPPH